MQPFALRHIFNGVAQVFVLFDQVAAGIFPLKTQPGLSDFRVRAYEAVEKYMVVVLLTWVHVERRFGQERSAQIKTCSDLIRRHWDEHAIEWLSGAVKMMQETGDLQAGLKPLPAPGNDCGLVLAPDGAQFGQASAWQVLRANHCLAYGIDVFRFQVQIRQCPEYNKSQEFLLTFISGRGWFSLQADQNGSSSNCNRYSP